MRNRIWTILLVLILLAVLGFTIVKMIDTIAARMKPSDNVALSDDQTEYEGLPQPIRYWMTAPFEFDQNLAVLETVFWDARDSESLRKLIREDRICEGKSVLEIGTGSGFLSLCCLKNGATKAVATDVNEAAVANARFNAEHLKLDENLDVRIVDLDDSGAFAVIKDDEKFDLIISNPPWVDREPRTIDEYALYDANFDLMKSLFEGMPEHLNPGGRVLLAYGCVDAIKTMKQLAQKHNYEMTILDDRDLDELPEEFLPGMLVEIKPRP